MDFQEFTIDRAGNNTLHRAFDLRPFEDMPEQQTRFLFCTFCAAFGRWPSNDDGAG